MGFSKNPLLDPKIQDGGYLPSWKSWNHHIATKIIRFWWNLVHTTQQHIWNSVIVTWPGVKTLTFKMDSHNVENRFWPKLDSQFSLSCHVW